MGSGGCRLAPGGAPAKEPAKAGTIGEAAALAPAADAPTACLPAACAQQVYLFTPQTIFHVQTASRQRPDNVQTASRQCPDSVQTAKSERLDSYTDSNST